MKEFFRQLNLLFLILLSGQIFFCLIVLFIISNPDSANEGNDTKLFNTLIPVFILSRTFAIHLIDKSRKKRGVFLSDVKEKFRFYRNSVFLRLVLMEATNIFAMVIALIEGEI